MPLTQTVESLQQACAGCRHQKHQKSQLMPDHGMSLLQRCRLTFWLVKHVCEQVMSCFAFQCCFFGI